MPSRFYLSNKCQDVSFSPLSYHFTIVSLELALLPLPVMPDVFPKTLILIQSGALISFLFNFFLNLCYQTSRPIAISPFESWRFSPDVHRRNNNTNATSPNTLWLLLLAVHDIAWP
jgi:hypothetical protein